jgi:hypothetical protein
MTGRIYYSPFRDHYKPCAPYPWSRCVPYCPKATAAIVPDGLRGEVIQLRDEVQDLRRRVTELERKAKKPPEQTQK